MSKSLQQIGLKELIIVSQGCMPTSSLTATHCGPVWIPAPFDGPKFDEQVRYATHSTEERFLGLGFEVKASLGMASGSRAPSDRLKGLLYRWRGLMDWIRWSIVAQDGRFIRLEEDMTAPRVRKGIGKPLLVLK